MNREQRVTKRGPLWPGSRRGTGLWRHEKLAWDMTLHGIGYPKILKSQSFVLRHKMHSYFVTDSCLAFENGDPKILLVAHISGKRCINTAN